MTRDEVFEKQPILSDLEKKLGALGGDQQIVLTAGLLGGFLSVLDVDAQMERGQQISCHSECQEGTPNECHENSIRLLEKDQANILMSGFALADDGKWYHHSWCIRDENGNRVIIETVCDKFKQYFGIEYRGHEAIEKFRRWLDQYFPKSPLERKPGSDVDAARKILQDS